MKKSSWSKSTSFPLNAPTGSTIVTLAVAMDSRRGSGDSTSIPNLRGACTSCVRTVEGPLSGKWGVLQRAK